MSDSRSDVGGHTPGPWQVSGVRHSGDLKIGRDTRLHAVGPDGDAVAMVFYDMKTGGGFKDARLIAAAPDHALIGWAMCVAAGRWEPSQRADGSGEFCINGMRHSTKLDEFGVPTMTDALRTAIAKAQGAA